MRTQEETPTKYAHILDKGAKAIQWRKESLCKLSWSNWVSINPNLNRRCETLTLLEKNTELLLETEMNASFFK